MDWADKKAAELTTGIALRGPEACESRIADALREARPVEPEKRLQAVIEDLKKKLRVWSDPQGQMNYLFRELLDIAEGRPTELERTHGKKPTTDGRPR